MTRIEHLITFLGLFAAVLAAAHLYLWARISHYLHLSPDQRNVLALIFGALAVLSLISLPISRLLPREIAAIMAWVIFPWMGIILLMVVVMFATDMIWALVKFASPGYDPERRLLIQRGFGLAALGTTALLGGYSLWNGLRPITAKPLTVTLKRLPKSLDGLRIAQITDLHVGPMVGRKWVRQVVDKVNALKPDLIAVTGDMVDGPVEELSGHVAPLADLTAPLGVFFVTGNHEYYSGVEPWCAHFANLGLRVLRNERVSIKTGLQEDSFDLAGVDDWRSRQFPGEGPNLPKALAGRDPHKTVILLAHQPAAVDEASLHNVDLQLSGHTHGGQIWPFKYLVYLQQPYVEGLHQHRDTQVYVSPGTGFWGPPMRFGTAAEITHITLRAAV